ncbi:hypothetical protein [Roseobacter sinensis]|uniref:Uncharacterized protein n=1 Tax=Roseobacter sinensis TaxID=2931391 RepID=A0ABT3BFX6_9RHOB|nr:hypothetical protein [Roseobacter sp. WL0113]MCV3272458.1 hypothetical protein [Roseobacter sp. WL0113]
MGQAINTPWGALISTKPPGVLGNEGSGRPRASREASAVLPKANHRFDGGGRALPGGSHRALALGFALLVSTPLHALSVEDCTRVTHISHGGEADHIDLGEGRVMWRDWWSQEGSATDITVMDCGPGAALTFRAAEENMNARFPFNRVEDALKVIATHESGARVFATLERMAEELKAFTRDVRIETRHGETCACAAFYPETRGDKTEFVLG